MNKFSRFLIALAATPVLMAAAAVAPASAQGMADDSACVLAGLLGEEFGLCNAYCEAMDCDSDNPQASTKACEKVKSKFEAIAFDPELPCLYNPSLNAPPTLDLNASDGSAETGTTATFVSYGGAVPIAVDVEITDGDGDDIVSATVELMNPTEDETLSLSPQGHDLLAGLDDHTGGTLAGEGSPILTITGVGTWDQYEEILQEVLYDNSDGSPSTVLRTISVAVSDGIADADSDTAVTLVTVSVGCPCTAISSGDFLTHPGSALFGKTQDGGLLHGGWGALVDDGSCWAWSVSSSSSVQIPYTKTPPAASTQELWLIQFNASEREGESCVQLYEIMTILFDPGSEQAVTSANFTLLRDRRSTVAWPPPPADPDISSPPVHIDVFTSENASACEADRRALTEFIVANLTNEDGQSEGICDFSTP